MENHLIIGLGGTGGNIIKAFRKRVFEEFRTNKLPNKEFDKVCISYMWVDSSTRDMKEKQSWRTLGKSVALDPGDQVLINETTASIFENIDSYPSISAWIGDRNVWGSVTGGITDDTGGQRRRLGRLLFAWNIDEFSQKFDEHVQYLNRTSRSEGCTFHVCAGLAGGTGSGSLLDVLAHIRSKYRDSQQYRIVVYTKLPETATVPPTNWASTLGYYRPNGYAALLELNAFAVKSYMPYDLRGSLDRQTNQVRRLCTDRGITPLNCVYVFSNVNNNGGVIDVADGSLFEVVADYLYHKIITTKRTTNTVIDRLQQNENGESSAEDGVRSTRFMSFGMGRIEYPEQEIREFYQYSFEKQAVMQLKYNNWSDLGFIEKPEDEIGTGYVTELRNDRHGKFPGWRIDEDHLMLSQKIMEDGSAEWLPFGQDWEKITHYRQLVKDKEKVSWLSELEMLCAKRYNEEWRKLGVPEFFRAQREELKSYASHIRGLIEKDLFKDWENGDKSIVEVEKYLQVLIDENEKRIEKYGDRQLNLRTDIKEKIEPKIQNNRDEWNRLGGWSNIMGKHDKLLNAHVELMKKWYKAKTEVEGYDYAQQLLRKVNEQLRELRDVVREMKRRVTDYLDKIENAINSRCQTSVNTGDGRGSITYKMYNPEEIRNKTRNYVRDDKLNRENALNVRKKMIAEIHDENPDFSKMMRKCDMTVLINTLDMVCGETASSLVEREREKVGKVNILEILASQFRHDEEKLGEFIEDKIRLSGVLVKKNDEEVAAGSRTATDGFRISYALLLPEYEDSSNFRDMFIDKFRSIVGSSCTHAVNYKSNEIIIMALTAGMPLRYIEDVRVLKEEYDAKISETGYVKHKLLLHSEGDGSQYPSLYPEKWTAEKREKFAPYLVLAIALGIVKYDYLYDGSGKKVYFYTDNGKIESLHKEKFRNIVESIDEETAQKIQNLTLSRLGKADLLSRTKRAEIETDILENISPAISKEYGLNRNDLNRFVDARNAAAEILKEYEKDRMYE